MNITEQEYLRAAALFERRRGLLSYRAPVLALAVALAALAVWGFVADGGVALAGVVLLVFAAALAVWMLVLCPQAAKKRALAAMPAYMALVGGASLSVSADGITLSGDCVFTYDFGRMVELLDAPDMLVLIVDTHRFVVCPKRALEDAQLRALRHGCARKTRLVK